MIFFLVLAHVFLPDSFFLKHELLEAPSRKDLAITESSIFYLNRSEHKLIQFNADNGQLIRVVAERGQGPGSFYHPEEIRIFTDHFVVIFSLQGEFQKRIRINGTGMISFVYTPNAIFTVVEENDSQRLEKRPPDQNSGTVILKWPKPDKEAEYSFSTGGQVEVRVNPAPEKLFACLSQDNTLLLLREPGTSTIHVVETHSGHVLRSIPAPVKPMPFDKVWGQAQISSYRKRIKNMRITPAFPDKFPLITQMWVTPDNKLGLRSWSPKNRPYREYFLNYEGHAEQKRWPDEVQGRILKIKGKWAFVSLFDSDEDVWGVGRCSIKELSDFITANPINLQALDR